MTTILIARPEPQARRTAERLIAKGFEAIVSPALVITPVDAAAPAGVFDGIIAASGNAIAWLAAQGTLDKPTPLFAVGARTAEAARAAGFTNVHTAEGNRAALAAVVRGALRPAARLLAPVGREHHADLVEDLRTDGYVVESPVVYAADFADKMSPEAEAALRYDVADAVLHYSARSVSAFFALLAQSGVAGHGQRLKHICLSAQVADALPADVAGSAIVAAQPDDDAMIDAVVQTFDPASSTGEARQSGKSRKVRPRAFPLDAKATEAVAGNSIGAVAPVPVAAAGVQDNLPAADAGSERSAEPVRPLPAVPAHAVADQPVGGQIASNEAMQPSATAQRPAPDQATVHVKRHRVWPVAATAGVAGGIIGAAASLLLPAILPNGWLPAQKEPDVAAIIASQIKPQLDARLINLPAKSEIEALQKNLAVETTQRTQALAGIQTAVADLSRRLNETAQLARNAPDQAAAAQRAVAEIAKRVDLLDGVAKVPYDIVGLSKRVDDIAARKPDAPPDLKPLDRQVAEANAAIAALRGQVEALAAKPVPDTGRPMRLHALANAITTALQRGAPFKTEFDAAIAAGAAPAVMQPLAVYAAQGAPTGQALAKIFEPLAPRMLAALEPPPPANPGLVDRMRMMATSMVKVRPVGQNAGDSPAGRIAQIEAALGRSQFGDAVKNWQALPDVAKAAGGSFGTTLQVRADAEAAGRAFLEESTRALARQGQ